MANTTSPAPLTDAEAAEMQERLDAYRASRAAAAAADRAAKLKPLTDLLGSEAWTELRSQLAAAETASQGEPFFDQVRALNVISGNLSNQVASAG